MHIFDFHLRTFGVSEFMMFFFEEFEDIFKGHRVYLRLGTIVNECHHIFEHYILFNLFDALTHTFLGESEYLLIALLEVLARLLKVVIIPIWAQVWNDYYWSTDCGLSQLMLLLTL